MPLNLLSPRLSAGSTFRCGEPPVGWRYTLTDRARSGWPQVFGFGKRGHSWLLLASRPRVNPASLPSNPQISPFPAKRLTSPYPRAILPCARYFAASNRFLFSRSPCPAFTPPDPVLPGSFSAFPPPCVHLPSAWKFSSFTASFCSFSKSFRINTCGLARKC